MPLADFTALLNDLARDQGAVLAADARTRALEAARLQYSADCPRLAVEDVTWPGGSSAPAPAGWTEGAWVESAEYPIGRDPRAVIEVAPYLTPDGWQIMAACHVPAGAVVRLTMMAEHVLAADADTIPARHRLPVAQYAAHLLCHQLATYYSAQREASMGADASMTETRARQFADRARELRTAYFAGVGVLDPFKSSGASSAPGAAAAGVVSWPSLNPRHRLVRRNGA
ncbi:MAG: hypothetical protein QM569_14880 [Acidovorax sp.]|uniref:hypothetical protein n=1 Tax=Acidovorax sp. TaxID=1872122 RepID=UPI0039E47434